MNAVDFISELGETSPLGRMCVWWGLFVVCSVHLLIHSAQPVLKKINCFYLAIIIDSYAAVRNNVDSWTWWRSLVAPGGLWLESSLSYIVRHCCRPPPPDLKPNQVLTNNNSKIMCGGMCPLPSVLMTTSCRAQYMHVGVCVWGWV